jgi:flavin-dependent dehydrogenase
VSEGGVEPEADFYADLNGDVDADVVVAGGGGAGLAAALSAAQHGASVVLAEARQNFHFDCNTSMSTSMVPAGGTRWQRELPTSAPSWWRG